jgi:hypothetical protein
MDAAVTRYRVSAMVGQLLSRCQSSLIGASAREDPSGRRAREVVSAEAEHRDHLDAKAGVGRIAIERDAVAGLVLAVSPVGKGRDRGSVFDRGRVSLNDDGVRGVIGGCDDGGIAGQVLRLAGASAATEPEAVVAPDSPDGGTARQASGGGPPPQVPRHRLKLAHLHS